MAETATSAPGRTDRAEPELVDGVQIVDVPAARVHHPGDLLTVVLCAVGIVLVLVLATYAQNTTVGVAEDVRGFASLVRRILFIPVAALEILVTVILPAAVLVELAVRRLVRQILDAVAAAVLALLLAAGVHEAIVRFGSADLVGGLSVTLRGAPTLAIPGYIALVSAFLTTTGPRSRRRTVRWSWNLTWLAVVVVLVTGEVSLPGVGVALLLGRMVGMGVRYLSGVQSERAYGASLVAGLRRAGTEPVRLVRVADDGTPAGGPDVAAPAEPVPAGTSPAAGAAVPAPTTAPDGDLPGPATRALARSYDQRVYEAVSTAGVRRDVVVLDGDRVVPGVLARAWRSIRLRGIEGRSVVSLRQAAERSALLAYAARAAGVHSPRLLGIAEADDSMLLVQDHIDAVALSDLDPEVIDDAVLHGIWEQLRTAHAAGLAHRALTSDVVLVEPSTRTVWIVGWQSGDIASSELARRMDLTQTIALLALRVGAPRALQSAAEVLTEEDIVTIGPLLQPVALPQRTRDEMRAHREVLAELRSALVARLPQADVQPEQLVRFGGRTLLTIVLTVVAVIAVLTTINVNQVTQALATSDWRWSALAFALGLATLAGGGLTLVAFSPVRLSVWRASLVQSAATFIALAAPAGIGPAALNLRTLTKRGVSTPLAAATVALVQVAQFVVTIGLLLVLSIASGTSQAARFQVTPTMLVVIGVVAGLVAVVLLVPALRGRIARRTMPTLRQTWPRLLDMLGQPWRLAMGVVGNIIMTMGYVLAFDASLAAFGQHLSLVQVALVYLAGNAAGAAVPTPGGLGTTEFALTTGLISTGVNPGIAASVAVLFRVLTYWLRIPLGWLSMHYLQRAGEL